MQTTIGCNTLKTQIIFFVTLLFLEITVFLSNDMFLPAIREIAEVFKLDISAAQQSITLWFFGSAIVQLVAGAIDDYFGHKKTLIAGAINFILASSLCAFTTDYTIFSIGRFFEGASVGIILTAGYSLIHEANHSIKAIKIISIMRAFSIIPAAVGPTVGAIFIQYFDWQDMFVWFFVCGLICMMSFIYYTPSCDQKLSNKIAIKTTAISYANMLKNKTMMLYTICSTIILMILVYWIVESVKIIMYVGNKSIMEYGIIQCLIALMLSVGSFFASKIARQKKLKSCITSILLVKFCCMLLGWGLLSFYDVPITLISVLVGIVFLCSGAVSEVINRLAIESSTESVGMSNAFIIAIRSMGAAIACAMTGFITIDIKVFCSVATVYLLLELIIFIQIKKVELNKK